jgi:hypothetical protein
MAIHLLPRFGESTLCRVEPGYIYDLYNVPAPLIAPYAVSPDESWLAFFTNRKDPSIKTVSPHDKVNLPLSLLSLKPTPMLQPPEVKRVEYDCARFRPYSFLFDGNRLFIGGSRDCSCLGYIDMDDAGLAYHPIALPRSYTFGKAIDALLLHEGKLLAIDNCIEPMYVWEYDVANKKEPVFVQEAELGMSIYPEVRTASKHDEFFAVLYNSFGEGGSSDAIGCYHLKTLEHLGSLGVTGSSRFEPQNRPKTDPRGPGRYTKERPKPVPTVKQYRQWFDMTIFNNYLLLAAGSNGLAFLPFSKFMEFSDQHLPRYLAVPGFKEVVRVIGLEESDCLIVVGTHELTDGKLHAEIFTMDELLTLPSEVQAKNVTWIGQTG